ncbi:hypothetical protein FB451DRAFT_406127 [Mycena latifolia]|nr:hypothetical protein FB451DRAFT_406127 [Mycena latifolia]
MRSFQFLPTLAAGLAVLLSSATVTSAQLSDQQLCLLNCSTTAVDASACDIEDTACICASTVYVTNITQCAVACKVGADDITTMLAQECPKGHVSAASTAPNVGGAKNAAGYNAVRIGTAAASAAGLIFYALLV